VKLHALMKMFDRLQPVRKREAGVTANVLQSLIDRMKGDTSRRCHFGIPDLKQSHTLPMVVLLSMKEQKRVQEGQ
jgi:hypothetical protein